MPKQYTGQLVKAMRPEVYRDVVERLAEPRQHVSYRSIERDLNIGIRTIKAIEMRESETIAERKSKMLRQVARCAEKAWQVVEDKLNDNPNLAQATICAGVSTEKLLLLAGEPTQHIAISLNPQDIYSELRQIQAHLVESVAVPVLPECTPDPA